MISCEAGTGVAVAGQSSLAGRVVRNGDGAPVVGAEVWAVSAGVRVRTDTAGRFHLCGLKSGPEIVQVRQIGYTMRVDTISLLPGQETTRQLTLLRDAALLDTVRTNADSLHYLTPTLRAFEERRHMAIGHFISEAELRKNDDRSLDNVMLKSIPGVHFVPSSRGTEIYAASNRGAAWPDPSKTNKIPPPCLVRVMLDGVFLYNAQVNEAPFDIRRIQVRDLGGVEFYSPATTPAQFATMGGFDCGLLLLWTRER